MIDMTLSQSDISLIEKTAELAAEKAAGRVYSHMKIDREEAARHLADAVKDAAANLHATMKHHEANCEIRRTWKRAKILLWGAVAAALTGVLVQWISVARNIAR